MNQLPITAKRRQILDAIRGNQVTIVVGETGSGKTTQLPVFLYEDGYTKSGRKIGVTQPRRIAATSVAAFVARQLGTQLGDKVGYQIRFDDQTADNTTVKFMTDGILLQEIQADPDLKQYSVIMVDEAHERSENIDFLLGLLKDLLKRRPDLKVVVTSATIDEQKFSRYFDNAPIINVSGRMYPVDVVWSDFNYEWSPRMDENEMVDAVTRQVVKIHTTRPPGDILVFMTGRDDITAVIEGLGRLKFPDLLVLPVYGELPSEDQMKIFDYSLNKRKVIVATNIAETSITVDGIVYVVDSGLIKQSNFHSDTGIKSLDVVEHSQAGCDQRTGRAGRMQSGICYRMYTKQSFRQRQSYTTPEILRVSLADVVLKMEDIGIPDIEAFDFIDPPDREAFHEAYQTLIALGAIIRGEKGLTEIGRAMARLPLEPRISRMVLEAKKHGCVKNVVTIAAFLSVRNVFVRPKDDEYEADLAHAQFKDEKSDAITFLNIWSGYEASNFDGSWCRRNFLHARTMSDVRRTREQLFQILSHHGMELTECTSSEATAKAVVMGLAYNVFEHSDRGAYYGVLNTKAGYVYIHPSSGLFSSDNPRFMVATEVIRTTKVWGRICTSVEPEWLLELVPHLCTLANPVVESWTPGETVAMIRQDILYKGLPIHSYSLVVSVEEAARIQNENIRDAEKQGYVRLKFERMAGSYGEEWWAYRQGTDYKAWSSSNPEEGVEYLCKTESFMGKQYATLLTRLFNFPTIPLSEKTMTTPAIAALAGAWGARRTVVTTPVSNGAKVAVNGESLTAHAASQVAAHESTHPSFTEMGSRWFKCRCGTTLRVSKANWAAYATGGVLNLDCENCLTFEQRIKK